MDKDYMVNFWKHFNSFNKDLTTIFELDCQKLKKYRNTMFYLNITSIFRRLTKIYYMRFTRSIFGQTDVT